MVQCRMMLRFAAVLLPLCLSAAEVRFACSGGESFTVDFRNEPAPGFAVLHVPDRPPLVLPQTPAASGARYSDGFTVLWTKGEEAMVESGTFSVKGCRSDRVAALTGRWTLVELSGAPVTPARAAFIEFAGEGSRVAGSSGCNRFTGTFEQKGSALKFGPTASTRMACPGPAMEIEQRFFKAMGDTAGFRTEAGLLALLDGSGAAVAKLRREK